MRHFAGALPDEVAILVRCRLDDRIQSQDGYDWKFLMSKVWLVTGSASGLGRNIAEAVLASGDRLVATARDARHLQGLVEKYGDHVRAAALDVTNEGAAHAAVRVAVNAFGRLDV